VVKSPEVGKTMPTESFLAIFIFSFVVGFGAVVTPGPVSTAIVSQAPRRGWLVGPLLAAGHTFLELIMVVLIALGLSTVLAHRGAQISIAVLGGLLMLWMGGIMLWSVWKGKAKLPSSEENAPKMNNWQLLGLGMLATISNPFWYAWWVTVAAGYLAQAEALVGGIAAFYIGHIMADFAWNTTLSTIIGSGKRWITDRVYQIIILLSGAFFIYLGTEFLFFYH
jgi:threonine/homoserine/homoserine lactone efflux protein